MTLSECQRGCQVVVDNRWRATLTGHNQARALLKLDVDVDALTWDRAYTVAVEPERLTSVGNVNRHLTCP